MSTPYGAWYLPAVKEDQPDLGKVTKTYEEIPNHVMTTDNTADKAA